MKRNFIKSVIIFISNKSYIKKMIKPSIANSIIIVSFYGIILLFTFGFSSKVYQGQKSKDLTFKEIKGSKPFNVIFILSDDHRYDFMGFTGEIPGLETPNMDRMEGYFTIEK